MVPRKLNIRRLLDLIGFRKNIDTIMPFMSKVIPPMWERDLPKGGYRQKLIPLVYTKWQSKVVLFFLDHAVAIYDKYFSDDEIKGLIQFFEMPVAQKMISMNPQITKETLEEGRKFGRQAYRDSVQEILVERPDLKPALGVATESAQPKPSAVPPAFAAQTRIDPAKEAQIRRLMVLTKEANEKLMIDWMQFVSNDLQSQLEHSLPTGKDRKMAADLVNIKFQSKFSVNSMIDLAVPIYDKYYSREEIDAQIKFCETPLGQKMSFFLPQVMKKFIEEDAQPLTKFIDDSLLEVLVEHRELAEALAEAKQAAKKTAQPK
jgi:hypothetical protein